MPRVEKVRGGRFHHRETGRLSIGDTADVSEEMAAYLCEERGDFERVDELEEATVSEDDIVDTLEEATGDICGAEMSDNSTCERPADECPYHGDGEED